MNNQSLPTRSIQHISETTSVRVLRGKVPDRWLLRDLSERDYGIDFYLELVNEKNELISKIALIQMKSRQAIAWTKEDTFTLTGIEISTTNYWNNFDIPVFLFLADTQKGELYFISVKSQIRTSYLDFNGKKKFNYIFRKTDVFSEESFVKSFDKDMFRHQFETELLHFVTHIKEYRNLQMNFDGDCFLGFEDEELVAFESMHSNYSFLSKYLNINTDIPTIQELKKISQTKFGDAFKIHYGVLSDYIKPFELLSKAIISKIKEVVLSEDKFFMLEYFTLWQYIMNEFNNETEEE